MGFIQLKIDTFCRKLKSLSIGTIRKDINLSEKFKDVLALVLHENYQLKQIFISVIVMKALPLKF